MNWSLFSCSLIGYDSRPKTNLLHLAIHWLYQNSFSILPTKDEDPVNNSSKKSEEKKERDSWSFDYKSFGSRVHVWASCMYTRAVSPPTVKRDFIAAAPEFTLTRRRGAILMHHEPLFLFSFPLLFFPNPLFPLCAPWRQQSMKNPPSVNKPEREKQNNNNTNMSIKRKGDEIQPRNDAITQTLIIERGRTSTPNTIESMEIANFSFPKSTKIGAAFH